MREFVIDSLKAGILIGFGCIAYVVIPNHILGSFIFSLGLLTVCIKQLWLYTGRIGSIDFNDDWCWIYYYGGLVLNFVGIYSICSLFGYFSGLDFSAANPMITNKAAETDWNVLIRSIGCGAMMEIAVSGWKKTQNYLAVIMPVMCFILCGFEHCIADFGYMVLSGTMIPWFILIAVVGNTLGSWLISKI